MPHTTEAEEHHWCGVCSLTRGIAADASCIEDLNPAYMPLLVEHHPHVVDQALLALNGEDVLVGSKQQPPVVTWLVRIFTSVPSAPFHRLVAARVAMGLLRAQPVLGELKVTSWWFSKDTIAKLESMTGRMPKHDLDLWCQIGVLAGLNWEHSTEREGVRADIRHLAETHSEIWATSLPWLFRVGQKLQGLDVALTIGLARTKQVVAQALETCATNPVPQVRLRAAGTQTLMRDDTGDTEPWLLDALATEVDRRRDQFPRPLAGPAATWLSDFDLESLVRGSARLAQREFADVVRDQGAAEEEGLTQQLLALLAKHFERVDHVVTLSGSHGAPPQIALAQRTVPKHEETTIGADLGIVVRADLPGALVTRFGDLVQVKKTLLLTAPRGRVDSWRIDIPQLVALLHHSATAVYWLIRRSGEIFVVPAKLLAALNAGRDRPRLHTFTARYGEVRHVAIPLEQYLCDLVVGMWLGTTAPDTLGVIDGTNSRTRPRTVLEIAVRRLQG